jgi:predicted secreted protein
MSKSCSAKACIMLQVFVIFLVIAFLVLFALLSMPLKDAAKQQNEKPKLKSTRLE